MRDDILDRRILSLSERDHLRLRDLVEGTLITGAPGSGKSSTSGKQIGYGLLRTPNTGGLVLTAKAEETQNWINYAKACGREKDLIIFNAESGHTRSTRCTTNGQGPAAARAISKASSTSFPRWCPSARRKVAATATILSGSVAASN